MQILLKQCPVINELETSNLQPIHTCYKLSINFTAFNLKESTKVTEDNRCLIKLTGFLSRLSIFLMWLQEKSAVLQFGN